MKISQIILSPFALLIALFSVPAFLLVPPGILLKLIENTVESSSIYFFRTLAKIMTPYRRREYYRSNIFSNYFLKTTQHRHFSKYYPSTSHYLGHLISFPIKFVSDIASRWMYTLPFTICGMAMDFMLEEPAHAERQHYGALWENKANRAMEDYIIRPVAILIDSMLDVIANTVAYPSRALISFFYGRKDPIKEVIRQCLDNGSIKNNGEFFSHPRIPSTLSKEILRLENLVDDLDVKFERSKRVSHQGLVDVIYKNFDCCKVPVQPKFNFLNIKKDFKIMWKGHYTETHAHKVHFEKPLFYKFVKYRERFLELSGNNDKQETRTPINLFTKKSHL